MRRVRRDTFDRRRLALRHLFSAVLPPEALSIGMQPDQFAAEFGVLVKRFTVLRKRHARPGRFKLPEASRVGLAAKDGIDISREYSAEGIEPYSLPSASSRPPVRFGSVPAAFRYRGNMSRPPYEPRTMWQSGR